MKRVLWSVVAGALLVLVAVSPGAQAAENSQQTKMTRCNADAKAKSLAGDDRKAFMKTCLSANGGSAAKTNSQQEKMKTCNADAKTKNLKGDDRRKFMSDCLKGS